jgi:sulfur carrier protein ThiS
MVPATQRIKSSAFSNLKRLSVFYRIQGFQGSRIQVKKQLDVGMMKVHVKLHGVLGDMVPGYNHEAGLAVEIRETTTFGGLIRQLGFPDSSGAFAIEDGRVMKRSDIISGEHEIRIMQPLNGG